MACSGLASLPDAVHPDHVAAITLAMQGTGIGIAALSATSSLIHPDAVERQRGLMSVRVLASVAQQLQIPVLTLCTGSRNVASQWETHPDNTSADAWRDLCGSMAELIEAATAADAVLAIEPEPANVVDSAVSARRLLDELASDRVGIIIDAANLIDPAVHTTPGMRRDVVTRAVDLLADCIVLVHAKDRTADGRVVAPGQGVVDFDRYFRDLAAAGVQAPVIAHGLNAGEAASTAVFLRERLETR